MMKKNKMIKQEERPKKFNRHQIIIKQDMMIPEKKNNNDDEGLHRFGRHCQYFYGSSLTLRLSSSKLSSSIHQVQEEKKADENCSANDDDMNDKYKRHHAKIVLETFDRINIIHSMTMQPDDIICSELQSEITDFKQQHVLVVEQYHDILLDCGLRDIDRFIQCSSLNKTKNGDDGGSSCLLQQYTQIRDTMRQRAHKISMVHRQQVLYELLSEYNAAATIAAIIACSTKPRLTQIDDIQHTLSTIQKFVKKYQCCIGSHPFLAGLHSIIEKQIANKDPSYIIRWNFRGSVLTEACRSISSQNEETEYIHDAIEVLFSCLIWIKGDDKDLEGGDIRLKIPSTEDDSTGLQIFDQQSIDEPMLSFELEKHISNSTLRRILDVLPNPKRQLEARATGSIEELDCKYDDSLVPRKNVNGHEDEQSYWAFSELKFCNLL